MSYKLDSINVALDYLHDARLQLADLASSYEKDRADMRIRFAIARIIDALEIKASEKVVAEIIAEQKA